MKTSKLPLWLYTPGLHSLNKRMKALYKQASLLPPRKLYIPVNAISSDLVISSEYTPMYVEAELTYTVWNDRTKELSRLKLVQMTYLRSIGADFRTLGDSKEDWEKSRELLNMVLGIIESEVKTSPQPLIVRDIVYDRLINHQTLSAYTYLTENGESATIPASKK